MDLLSETTINGTLHRVSNAWQPLTNLWEPLIINSSAPKFGLEREYGGFAFPKFGGRTFSPDLFNADWPPPKTIYVKDFITDDTEENAIKVFEGVLHLDSYDEARITYNVLMDEFDVLITDEVFGDPSAETLVDVFTWAVDPARLNLTLDSSAARSPSPDVSYTASGENVLIKVLSNIAAFFSHGFYIENGTLYLIDLLADNGSDTFDEFEFFRGAEYQGPIPYSSIKGGNFSVEGTYKYGKELSINPVCHDTQANIETALADIKTLVDYDRYRFHLIPEQNKLPVIGKKLTVTNESLHASTTTWLRTTDIMLDVERLAIVVEGFGASS